ncbi:MAG: pseudouridine synthase [Clostridia bacterium]
MKRVISMDKMRLQKYISTAGTTSRRKAEDLIFSGHVTVNGEKVTDIVMVNDEDDVRIDGKPVKNSEKKLYYVFNKPEMVITSMDDQFSRKTVSDFFNNIPERVYPVGRLDYDSSGVLFMTNDGDFANFMMHPSNEIVKTYYIVGKGEITDDIKGRLEKGVDIGGYVTSHAEVTDITNKNGVCEAYLKIHEGKNRQIRKMFEAVGIKVIRLQRTAIGTIELGILKKGHYRTMLEKELISLGYKK